MNGWKPVQGHIMTKWADEIDPAAPLPEYPRPQMVRPKWLNLNGLWEYAITAKDAEQPRAFDGKILVPFAIETALSGVNKPLLPKQKLWYRRSFTVPETWRGTRILLHFEAVDWQCVCYLNGRELGAHTGGYVPFSFDISEHLIAGTNDLALAVWDPTDTHWQQKGKQVLKPEKIYYTATSGIWQTVWLEPVSAQNHIERLSLLPDIDTESLEVEVHAPHSGKVRLTALSEGERIGHIEGAAYEKLRLPVPVPRLWRPQDPFLYDLRVELLAGGAVIDAVDSYFGMRKVSTGPGRTGRRIFFNNKPVFLHGPLDQGYWPDGGMTPPSDDAMVFDIENTLRLGFNMTRKHIKVEPRRWYYHADRLGLIVVQDMPNGGKDMLTEKETTLTVLFDRHRKDTTRKARSRTWRDSAESREDFERELIEVIDHLSSVPSIAVWVPFNESWGQYDAARIYDLVKRRDPSRLVDHASGWQDQGAGDFRSRHTYVIKLKRPPRKDNRIYFISEYGGYNYQESGHLWNEASKFGYRMLKDKEALAKAYTNLIRTQLIPLIRRGLGAAVYTQFSDVEIESNGFYTYDRKILKIEQNLVATLNQEIYAAFEASEKGRP
ncbi:MAG: glycoside hydrolase family 2 TIM barrel-domain containing protein [Candidatus Abyssubacteria bacterium]